MRKTRKKQKKKKTFTRKHYNSGDGMLTTVWGPSLWHYLHTMSFNYPVKPTKTDKNIIWNLSKTYSIHYHVNIVV